ncbi:carbon-nitrogen hydrolase family protein [candidate division KSB1 bacterium]
MSNNNQISRRRFLKNSTAGILPLGFGMSQTSKLFAADKNYSKTNFPKKNISPREAFILSLTCKWLDETDTVKVIKKVIERLEQMVSYNIDIICLPEIFAQRGSGSLSEKIEKTNTILNSFSSFAKQYNCYIICPVYSKKSDKFYNSAVLIDRQGSIAGQYDKIHPTEGECDNGITPGNITPPVFKTDFGIIGIQICFDINWMEGWKGLKKQGAEIVFWPSAYPGGRMLSSYAWIFKYYTVGCSWSNPSLIYDISGDFIAESGRLEQFAFASLNMEKILCEVDFNMKKVKDIRRKYGRKILIKYYQNEDWLTIESRSPDLKIKHLIDEYDLLPHSDYIKRAEAYQKNFR